MRIGCVIEVACQIKEEDQWKVQVEDREVFIEIWALVEGHVMLLIQLETRNRISNTARANI